MDDATPHSGSRSARGAAELLPFLGAAIFAFATIPLPPDTSPHVTSVVAAAIIVAGATVIAVIGMRGNHGQWFRALPAYLYILAVALLREAEGGAASGFGMLVLLPLTWLALYTGPAQLSLGIVAMALMFAIPILVEGEPAYPASEWRRMLLWCVVGTIAARRMQSLVARIDREADAADLRARTDALTQLPNRRELEAVLERELARAADRRLPLAVAMIDIDHFKAFNDTHGHAAGDSLLRDAATAWRATIRANDVLARYGGEEFTLVLPGCPITEATALADRLRTATPHEQSCSIGIVAWNGTETAAEVVSRADSMLYEAKRAGRDRVIAAGAN